MRTIEGTFKVVTDVEDDEDAQEALRNTLRDLLDQGFEPVEVVDITHQDPLDETRGKRWIYWINEAQLPDPERGYIPSRVFEDVSGHFPLVGDPSKHQSPWFWGDRITALRCAEKCNADMGIDRQTAMNILSSSFAQAVKEGKL